MALYAWLLDLWQWLWRPVFRCHGHPYVCPWCGYLVEPQPEPVQLDCVWQCLVGPSGTWVALRSTETARPQPEAEKG
jgi:hypothetical protein